MDVVHLLLILAHVVLWATLLANLLYLHRTRLRADSKTALPPISILIPARNEAENLRRLLPSLLSQDYPSFEVIVYDDASNDGTAAVLQSFAAGSRLTVLRGKGPPAGWVGKVHALFQATRHATGACYLFLDADAQLEDTGALQRLFGRFSTLGGRSVLTGLTRLRGGGALLVSLVPHTVLTALPWPLVRRLPIPSLSALNGQCWMIDADAYHRHEPHAHLPAEVLEDVKIGRYLKAQGLFPVLVDVQREVSVSMYSGYREAWQGFRKNAYLLMGGTPLTFIPYFILFALTFVLAPLFSIFFLLSLYFLKALTDHLSGFPLWVSLLAPVSFVLALLLQIDSALSHLSGRVFWKGRRVTHSH